MESIKSRKIAEFFYGFMPMDDFPVEEGIRELAEAIDLLPKPKEERYGLYTYLESAYEEMCDHPEVYDSYFNYDPFEEPKANYEFADSYTGQGVSYLEIARFLMTLADQNMVGKVSDHTHYSRIGKALKNIPYGAEDVLFVLSSAAENVREPDWMKDKD